MSPAEAVRSPGDDPRWWARVGTLGDPHSWAGLIERERVLTLALVDHRQGRAPLTREQFVTHTLAALAVRTEIAEIARSGRWVMAREALAGGATVEQTAAAMGFDLDELRTGLVCWAEGQRRHGLITDAEHDDVVRLVGGAR